MTPAAQRFPFVMHSPAVGSASLVPRMQIQLSLTRTLVADGLLDTGAAINVLPWSVGLRLGADWSRQTTPIQLTGSLASVSARALIVGATVVGLPPVRLAFAWANSDAVPLLLGQINFFAEFDVCFFRHRGEFEVRPKA